MCYVPDWKTLIKYAIVGASGVAVNMGVLYSLTEYFGLYYMVSAVIASELSIISNFIINNKWTFSQTDTKHSAGKRLLIYNAISIIGTVILLGIMYILTEWMSLYYVYSQWIGVVVVFGINYVLNKRITWSKNDN